MSSFKMLKCFIFIYRAYSLKTEFQLGKIFQKKFQVVKVLTTF